MPDKVVDLGQVPPNLVLSLDPKTIKLSPSQARYRKEMGDLKDLAASIQEKGQIQPILITRDTHTLVAGGRRLAACILGQMEVKAIYTDTIDPIKLREIELEENIKRKAFTPAEEVLAVQEIHTLKQAQHGVSGSGKTGGWTLSDTANLIGKTHASVIADIKLADLVKQYPELATAKKKNAIKKLGDGLERVAATISRMAEFEEEAKSTDGNRLWHIYHKDAVGFMAELQDSSINVLLTDPPYGIDISEVAINASNQTGGGNVSGFTFDDNSEKAINLYTTLACESFRFTTPDAHGFVFVAPEFFSLIKEEFTKAGWLAYIKPIIWVKRTSGQCNAPYAWPSSCYEMLLYVRKPASRLIKEGQPDWIECPIVEQKVHPTEKPVALLLKLLERVALPYQTLVDPFAGSGSSLVAATIMNLKSSGCDELLESYATALERLNTMNRCV